MSIGCNFFLHYTGKSGLSSLDINGHKLLKGDLSTSFDWLTELFVLSTIIAIVFLDLQGLVANHLWAAILRSANRLEFVTQE